MISEDQIDRSTQWFVEKGPSIILANRFFPGSRLPTYFGAGVLGAGFWMFTGYFFLAAAVWTPLLVGAATWSGQQLLAYFAQYQK